MQELQEHKNTQLTQRKTLILVSHPQETSLTLSAAQQAQQVLTEHNLKSELIHLDAINYNYSIPAEELLRKTSFDEMTLKFQKQLTSSQQLALFYPDWWGFPPAPLVGWLQRVLFTGTAFSYREKKEALFALEQKLSHIRIFYAITSDMENSAVARNTIAGLQHRLSHYAGIRESHLCMLCETRQQSYKTRQLWIKTCASILMQERWDTDYTLM